MTDEERLQLATHVLNAGRGGNAHGMSHAKKFVDKIEKIIDRKIEQALKAALPDAQKLHDEILKIPNSPPLPNWSFGREVNE